ncbi:formylglycine-generating enzyme family protein [Amnibacterium endophyticum]|uniref:Formylglycine-generating enzyme family protein n=1 Tax=Amnibacterium endophyticum TaxID=2109337 RepID=A0ABW4L939_9MICO
MTDAVVGLGAHGGGCCAPTMSRAGITTAPASAHPAAEHPSPSAARHRIEQARVPAQRFLMGDACGDGRRGDGESPVHPVELSACSIDVTTVTNAQFARFVDETGHRTDAERAGFSAVFHLAFDGDDADVIGVPPGTPWWLGVLGADWRRPAGRGSTIADLADHPVVHVSWYDAEAYCAWAGRALPTEAQWEAASRGGEEGLRYPWGDELRPAAGEDWPLNIWQGAFPDANTLEDGYLTTAPADAFAPNAYGLRQTVGNVWEWCADGWDARTYARDAALGAVQDPTGPVAAPGASRVLRGGSYLCHDSYCNRYRNSARTSNTPDSSAGNVGFRTVAVDRAA